MKRKIMATLLTVVMCATLVACGSSVDPNASALEREVEVTEPPVAVEPPTDEAEAEDEGWMEEQEAESTMEEASVDEVAPEVELSGIIVVQSYYYASNGGDSNVFVYDINVVDPNDGSVEKLTSLRYYQPYAPANAGYYFVPAGIGYYNRIGYDRRIFSSDFTKMAITIGIVEKNETHAGWIDSNGEFFDVTAALGETSGDFDPAVHHMAIGFTEDDMFVYNDDLYAQSYQWSRVNFFHTDANNPTYSQEGNLFQYPVTIDGEAYCMTDWCDEETYLADYHTKRSGCTVVKYNTTTGTAEELVSGEVRTNWSGVYSPDGSMIAFLSMTNGGGGAPEIYIMSADGSNPQKLTCELELSRDEACPCSIIGWK